MDCEEIEETLSWLLCQGEAKTMADANQAILDRESAVKQIQEKFSDEIQLLQEIVDYGTHLVPSAFGSSSRQLQDIIATSVLLKHMVEMLDAFQILIAQSAVQPASLQARSIFESAWYLDFILMEDPERRAQYYSRIIRRVNKEKYVLPVNPMIW
jgi:hypothetical protein